MNDPLWSSVVLMVEEYVTPRMLLIPGKWHVYSEVVGSFCQMVIEWLGFKDNLPECYESFQHLWLKVREYVNEAMINSRNGCRLRLNYRWKGENVLENRPTFVFHAKPDCLFLVIIH